MVVSFTVDSKAVQRKLKGASKKLRKHVAKHLRKKTKKDLESRYTRIAPKASGRLMTSKRTQVFEKNMTLRFSAGVGGRTINPKTGFDYGKWVLGQIPTITVNKPNTYFAVGQTIRYGDPSARDAKNRPVKWSASWAPASEWWNTGMVKYANRKIPQDVNQAVKEFIKDMNS